MIWYAAWCKEDGSLVAEAHASYRAAESHYTSNPHGLTQHQLTKCQWRGVFTQNELAENISKIL